MTACACAAVLTLNAPCAKAIGLAGLQQWTKWYDRHTQVSFFLHKILKFFRKTIALICGIQYDIYAEGEIMKV